MANEIKVNAKVTLTNNGVTDGSDSGTQNVNQSTQGVQKYVVSVATSAAALPIAQLTTLGWCWIKNLDPTNYVQLGVYESSTFYPLLRLLPGEAAVFRFDSGSTPYTKANTGAVELAVTLYNA